jgi:glutamate dehydrogenase
VSDAPEVARKPADPPSHASIIEALREQSDDRAELRTELARAAMRRVPDEHLAESDPEQLAARLNSLFDLIDERPTGEAVVQVLDPDTALVGEHSGTIVRVATEDRPFLLSTVMDELLQRELRIVEELHPIVGIERNGDGRIRSLGPARTAPRRESLLHLEVDRLLDPEEAEQLRERLRGLVADVMATTADHEPMRRRLASLADELRDLPASAQSEEAEADDDPEEVAELLEWLLQDNLVMLGLREYELLETGGERAFRVIEGSGLGLLTDDQRSRFRDPVPISELSEQMRERLDTSRVLTVARTRRLSTVQRQQPMEDLLVLRRDDRGNITSALRLLGLFTRKGYAEPAAATPVLRTKLQLVLEREDVVPGSHDEITLLSLFEALPKDELFRAPTAELHRTLVGLLHAEEHRQLRTLVRVDHELHAVSVLVTTPRDTWSPALRERLEELLSERYHADRVDVDLALGDRHGAVARFLLHVDGDVPPVSVTELQGEVRHLARPWIDAVTTQLREEVGEADGSRLSRQFASRLPHAYRESTDAPEAVADVRLLERHRREDRDLLVAIRPSDDAGLARIKAIKRGDALVLSAFLPILESLGLEVVEEVPYRLVGGDTTLHDFGVRLSSGALDADRLGPGLASAIHAAWAGHLSVDSLNRLIVCAGMGWHDVALLRAYRRYRRQVGTMHTPEYVNDVLVAEHEATSALVAHFHMCFDPAVEERDPEASRRDVVDACDAVRRLDHDRILRGMLALVDATVRTNAFRTDAVADGTGVPYLALKLDPSRVPDMPSPVPHREIFVSSPEVEGVHLRAGDVARGGLRWSDRRDDVRTEVLGLVKAQIRKNALIVPTGAKGGFVVKDEPEDPQELRDEVRRCYITFVRGLLDVTDNLEHGQVVPPEHVVRHDGDDTYLVVAADRGTATLSDTANALAERYGFWLDDAFASGGSNGYDHKELGVTARGTWVAVRRHFRELGVDVQSDPVTVAGIGDMSGDVFGNGMLRSRSLRLVAAFDHRHIFLDPDPDPEASFEERQRLFELPRSSWADYDESLISQGGGVHSRDAKTIALTDEVRELLRLDARELSPPELIQAILTAPVDLLYAGGIGTYVKASTERHEDVGDRSTEEVRVDADQLRARVLGEGANLFITQRGRIQYARRGGRVDQDAVHNAAGVVTSDREVNVKIFLNLAVEDGRIDGARRNELLQEVADEVVEAVMDDVDRQTACLSREMAGEAEQMAPYRELLHRLDERSEFDRHVEALPDDEELEERARAGAGLTRPELSTLLAWAKREIKEALLETDVPDHPVLSGSLPAYFPRPLVDDFGDLLPHHPLRRQLVATGITNDLVDRMGVTFASSLAAERGVHLSVVTLAWEAARQVLDADEHAAALEALTDSQDPQRLNELHGHLHTLLANTTVTLLADPVLAYPAQLIERDRRVARALAPALLTAGTEDQRRARVAHARWLVDDLVPAELARFIACARDLVIAPDVAVVSEALPDREVVDLADAFLRLGAGLGIDALERTLERVDTTAPWARRQRRGLETDLRRLRREAAATALRSWPDLDEPAAVEELLSSREDRVRRAWTLIEDLAGEDPLPLDGVAVATRAIADVVG